MTEYEKLHSGDIYDPGDEAILRAQLDCLEKQYDYNATRPSQGAERERLLREMFAEIGNFTSRTVGSIGMRSRGMNKAEEIISCVNICC